MKRFVIGDIHGAYKALVQCLNRSKFNKEKDLLIVLGDIVDGYNQVKESVDELLTIKHLIYIRGNHDEWFLKWAIDDWKESIWTSQGGDATLKSYKDGVPEPHVELIENGFFYYIDNDNKLFVHGGLFEKDGAAHNTHHDLQWDRELLCFMRRQHSNTAWKRYTPYDEIFIGHTRTNGTEPEHYCNLWNLDTGAGWDGKLTIMNIETKKYWQSDLVTELYKEGGR